MKRNCDNCYLKGYKDMWCIKLQNQPAENCCDKHRFFCHKCNSGNVQYEYNGELYCEKCLLQTFNVTEYTTTYYQLDGEYLGSEDDMDEVISNISDDINFID